MLKTTLPIIEQKIENDKLVVTKKNIDVSIDTSIYAEERWEANFPTNAKNETLFAYIERVQNSGDLNNKAHIVSNLKALYCFLEGDAIADFKSFCQMFDMVDEEYVQELVNKIKFVFSLVLKSSTTTPKN